MSLSGAGSKAAIGEVEVEVLTHGPSAVGAVDQRLLLSSATFDVVAIERQP